MLNEKLKELREQNGIKKSEIARELGITQAGYDRYEQGTSEPNIKTLIALSNKYNVTIDYLVKGYTEEIEQEEKERKIKEILRDTELRIINDVYTPCYDAILDVNY